MMPILGMSNREVDEEIASVEADGTDDADTCDGGDPASGAVSQHHGQSVEKKILTAALVTSIADVTTSCSTSESPPTHEDGGGMESTTRRAIRILSPAEHSERDQNHTIEFTNHEQDEQVGAHALIMDHASHVTPTTSEASSFSSVEIIGDHESSTTASNGTVCAYNQECDSVPQLDDTKSQSQTPTVAIAARPVESSSSASHSGGNPRTSYPRANESTVSNKVSAALVSAIKSSTVDGSSASSGLAPAKRKIDAGKTFDRVDSILCLSEMVF